MVFDGVARRPRLADVVGSLTRAALAVVIGLTRAPSAFFSHLLYAFTC